MSLTVSTDIPHGNAADLHVRTDGDVPEVSFSPSPKGGPEALWFCFRICETEPDGSTGGRILLTLNNFQNLLGAGLPSDLYPAYQPAGQGWRRMSAGAGSTCRDGRVSVSWPLPHPAPYTDVALCYPSGRDELATLLSRSKGYWKKSAIGVSGDGQPLLRLSNDDGAPGGRRAGLYLVARQHAGETPGSWVLEGVLQRLSSIKRDPFLVWVVPHADPDGIERGHYGKDTFPHDMNRAWGDPPMRHETLVYQRDIARWRERCKPALGIDFHAPGACESDGIYCYLPSPEDHPEMHRAAEKWANVMQQALGPQYAAEDFRRVARYRSRWETPTFMSYLAGEPGICALSIETPYSKIGRTVLTHKHYREIGQRIARGLMQKAG